MIQMLKESGVRNYSIFRHGLTLFGYFETDNLKNTISSINQSEINRKWGEYMAHIMKIEIDSERNFPYLLTSTAVAYGMKNLHLIPKNFHSGQS